MSQHIVEELKALGLSIEELYTDVVVVGGGGAASRAALSARLTGVDLSLIHI